MRYLSIATPLAIALVVGACSLQAPISGTGETTAEIPPPSEARKTTLLVSLEDGSIIKQTIDSNADFCFKMNSESTTTCLTEGAAVVDPETNAIVGFKMIEERIDLVAKSD